MLSRSASPPTNRRWRSGLRWRSLAGTAWTSPFKNRLNWALSSFFRFSVSAARSSCGDKISKRTAHWQAVALSACEQSGRAVVPNVRTPQSLSNILAIEHPVRLVLDPSAGRTLSTLSGITDEVFVAIGPEGGFSDDEIKQMTQCGFLPVQMGPRVLRAETAAVAAAAALQALHGDLGR